MRKGPDDRTGALAAASCHKFTIKIKFNHFLLLLSHESS